MSEPLLLRELGSLPWEWASHGEARPLSLSLFAPLLFPGNWHWVQMCGVEAATADVMTQGLGLQ